MKKIIFAITGILMLCALIPDNLDAKPIWIKFKIGLFAKWSITTGGNCENGWGLCISFGDNMSAQNYFGYDDETDKFYVKMMKSSPETRPLSQGSYELREDSPIDPRVIKEFRNFNSQGKKVVLKKGTYKILEEGEYYVMAVDYYLQ